MQIISPNQINLFWTVWYMRPKQAVYWVWRKLQFKIYKVLCPMLRTVGSPWPKRNFRPDAVPPEETVRNFAEVFTNKFAHLTQPINPERLNDLLENRFTFLNETFEIDPIDWSRRYYSHLWNYNLHYFDYAVWAARAWTEGHDPAVMRRCQNYIEWWIEETDVGRGDGWDPYPVSLRIVNWIYAYSLIAPTYDDQVFLAKWRQSIRQQIDYLGGHLEYHLLANHLLKNIKAMVIGSLFFGERKQARKWASVLEKELKEQVLPDGGHYERAPMYHAQVMADFLECYALLAAEKAVPIPDYIWRRLAAMASFLKELTFPDGAFAMFNDSACTDETWPPPLLQAARAIVGFEGDVRTGVKTFPQTGYYVWESVDLPEKKVWEKIVIDAGPPSVDYNCGHAHCDLLSYELWLGGRMFIVDSGVHGYGGDRFREYSRSTRAHNTVMFDDREQSRIWSNFRVGERARLLTAAAKGNAVDESFGFYGEYQTYDRGVAGWFDNSVTHRRYVHRSPGGEWRIEDSAIRGQVARASSFIHLHPDWSVEKLSESEILCRCETQEILIQAFTGAKGEAPVKAILYKGSETPVQGWWFSDFGIAWENSTIQFDFSVKQGDRFGYRIIVVN